MDIRLVQDPLRPARAKSVESALDALATDVQKRLDDTAERESTWADEESRRWRQFVDVLSLRHEETLASLYEVPGAHPTDAWERVRKYHSETIRSLWPDIASCLSHYEETPPPCRVWTDATLAFEAFCETLPVRSDVWLEPDFYTPADSDDLYATTRKAATRIRLWWRAKSTDFRNGYRSMRGREELPPPSPARSVKVSQIIRYHASVRIAGTVEGHVNEGERLLRQRAHRLVSMCAAWNRAILEAESDLAQMSNGTETLDERHVSTWREARHAARRFHEQIEGLIRLEAHPPLETDALLNIDEELRDDIARGGTYQLPDRRTNRNNRVSGRLLDEATRTNHRVEQLGARLRLEEMIFKMREAAVAHQFSLVKRMDNLSFTPVARTFTAMRTHIHNAEAIVRAAPQAPDALMSALDRTSEHLNRQLQSALSSLPGIATAGISAALPAGIDERRSEAARLPNRLVVAADADEDGHADPVRSELVDVSDHAARAFNETLNKRLRRDAELFRTEILGLWNDAEQATRLLSFNLNATRDELERRTHRAEGDVSIASLATEALNHTSSTIEQLEERLSMLWTSYEFAVLSLTQADWLRFVHGVYLDVAPQDGASPVGIHLQRRAADLVRRFRAQGDNGRDRIAQITRNARDHARGLVAGGRIEEHAESAMPALDIVADIADVVEELPFVYRRLFSFDPVSDAVFLEGRARDLETLKTHIQRRKRGRNASPICFLFGPGAGRTSFLNVVESVLRERGFDLGRVATDKRVPTEAVLADHLKAALNVTSEAESLSALSDDILSNGLRPESVVIVDHLESLMLQATDGTRLLERFFRFVERTSTAVLYVAAASEHASSLIRQRASIAPALTTVHASTPMTKSTLQEVILNRHRRSGLRLRFDAPAIQPTELKRRLRRASTDDERQSILSDHYFTRLYDISEGNIRLAILYWIRSIHIDSGVTVREPVRLDFSVIRSLDLDSLFALRAVFMHRTVGASELASILRINRQDSELRLGALHHQGLVVPTMDTRPPDSTVTYRINPLLHQPTASALRNRNML